MAIEIVSFPMKNGGSFHSYVNVYQRVSNQDMKQKKQWGRWAPSFLKAARSSWKHHHKWLAVFVTPNKIYHSFGQNFSEPLR